MHREEARQAKDGGVASPSVGSKGSKPRKPSHSQHLPKAGTKTDNQRLMHEEHQAILDTMGLGGAGKGTRTTLWVVGIVLLIGALAGLIVLTVVLS
jgi:hypothetical protein